LSSAGPDAPLGTVAPAVQPASTVAQRGCACSASGPGQRWGPGAPRGRPQSRCPRPQSWRTAIAGAAADRPCPDPLRPPWSWRPQRVPTPTGVRGTMREPQSTPGSRWRGVQRVRTPRPSRVASWVRKTKTGQAIHGCSPCPQHGLTIACKRLEIASAHASLRLFPAPDAWRSAFPKFLLNQKALDHRIASMDAQIGILQQVRQAAAVKILFLPHAVQQMAHPERMISTAEVRQMLDTGEVIEDYPDDPRGHSCLILGYGSDRRPIHAVCAPKVEYLAIITAYLPSPDAWTGDFRTRKET